MVVLITCGQAQCKKIETLVALSRKAYERVRQMVPKNAGESPGTAPPIPPPAPGATPSGTAEPGAGNGTTPDAGGGPAGTGTPPEQETPPGAGPGTGDSQ